MANALISESGKSKKREKNVTDYLLAASPF
jgi:hypothetical protein